MNEQLPFLIVDPKMTVKAMRAGALQISVGTGQRPMR